MAVQDGVNIQESSIDQKSSNTISVMLFTGATFVKKTPAQLLEQFLLILQVCIYLLSIFQNHTYPKILNLISVTLSYINDISIVPPTPEPPPALTKSYCNQYFQVSQLLKYNGNIVIAYKFFKAMLWWKCEHLLIASFEA